MIYLIIMLASALLVAFIFIFFLSSHISDLSEDIEDKNRQKELLMKLIEQQSIEISALSGTKIIKNENY